MSEVVVNINEQNSAQTNEATALSTAVAVDGTSSNVEAVVKGVPETADKFCSASDENAEDSGLKQDAEKSSISPKVDGKKSPVKRTPSKRMSFIERAQRESEELVKNMGGSLEIEGGRRTRSSTRGTPTKSVAASTPPPTKKARTSPTSGASTPTRPRGRGRKIEVTEDAAEEGETKATPNKKKVPAKGKNAVAKHIAGDEQVEEKPIEATDVEKKYEKLENNVDTAEPNPPGGSEGRKEKLVEKPKGDEADAVLQPVIEETESQVAADSSTIVTKNHKNISAPVENADESIKSDSPMETEEAKPVESLTEKGEAKPEAVELQEVKEPTPEPMDVDSSSKSNDALEKMEDDVVEIIEDTENQQLTAEVTPANVTELKNVENKESIKENSVVRSVVAAPPAGIAPNKTIAKPAAVADIANANENNTDVTTHAANDLNKSENDLCEPKIATSPPISAANDNSTVTTPQTCN